MAPTHKSIAAKLLKIVFTVYILVTVVVTLIHMATEYAHTRRDVIDELRQIQAIFSPTLSRGLWEMNSNQVKSAILGLERLPSVIGFQVADNKGNSIARAGMILKADGTCVFVDDHDQEHLRKSGSGLFWHEFKVYFFRGDRQFEVGKVRLYSSESVVFDKIALGFFFLVINAVIKTIVLWIIIWLVFKRILIQPLAGLTHATRKIQLDNLEDVTIDVDTSHGYELQVLVDAFNAMIQNLIQARTKLTDYAGELAHNRQLLQDIIDNTSAVIFIKDIDGRYRMINRRYAALFHISNKTIIGKQDHDLFPAKMADIFVENDQKALAADAPLELEELVPQDDGIHTYLSIKFPLTNAAGDAYAICGIATDITDRKKAENLLKNYNRDLKQAVDQRTAQLAETNAQLKAEIAEREKIEKALKRSERQMRLVTDNSPAYIAYVTIDDLTYQFVNRKFEIAFAKTREDIVGRHIREIIGEENYRFALPYIETVKTGRAASYVNTFGLEEGRRWIKVNYVPDFDETGHVRGIVVMSHDITDSKQKEAELLKAKEGAEAANKAKSQFLANMSHELRTPLNSIIGFSNLLSRNNHLNRKEKNNLEIIRRSGEHLLELINEVLELSKIEAGKVELHTATFDLHRVLNEIKQLFANRVQKKNLSFDLTRDPRLPRYISADEGKLRQILLNLIGNAIKFTDQGGLKLMAYPVLADKPDPNQVYVYFEVHDTGIGIDAAELHHIFEAFTQLDAGLNSQEGTGLGLTICRKYVQMMQGDMTVESQPGKGSVFKFYILTRKSAGHHVTAKPALFKAVRLDSDLAPIRILIVDDDTNNRQVLHDLLHPAGFVIQTAENGQQAVDITARWSPHLILMDLRMPILDGYAATREIKSKAPPPVPIIVAVTASAFEEEKAKVLSAGFDDYVAKPFDESILLGKIETHLNVRFIYEAVDTQDPNSRAYPHQALSSFDAALLPGQWKTQMIRAAENLDQDKLMALISEIEPQHPDLANVLMGMIETFEYYKISTFLTRDGS